MFLTQRSKVAYRLLVCSSFILILVLPKSVLLGMRQVKVGFTTCYINKISTRVRRQFKMQVLIIFSTCSVKTIIIYTQRKKYLVGIHM